MRAPLLRRSWSLRAACVPRNTQAAFIAAALLIPPSAATAEVAGTAAKPPVQVTWLVEYESGPQGEAAVAREGLHATRQLKHAVAGAVVRATAEQARSLRTRPGVLSVVQDSFYYAAASPRPAERAPWQLDRLDQRRLPLDGVFATDGTGSGVLAYVVDTGVSPQDELGPRLLPGTSTVGDGRGTDDCNGHGTHVAALVAGQRAGVAPGARVVPVRALGCDNRGTASAIVAALNWIARAHPAGTPALVNLSFAGSSSPLVDAAVTSLADRGLFVAAAAGNASADACSVSPAGVPAAFAVGASDRDDRMAVFTNTGPCVDAYAPGVDVESAAPRPGTDATEIRSGTSMSSPLAAGVAALHLDKNPKASPQAVALALTTAAVQALREPQRQGRLLRTA